LNLPPDRRGRIHDNDVQSLREFHRTLEATFAINLAAKAKITASNTRAGAKQFAPEHLLDQNRDTYWSTDDGLTTPEVTLSFRKPISFNMVSLREYLPLGQRVEAFTLEASENGSWKQFAAGTSIGNHRLIRGDSMTADKVRLRITKSAVCPALAEFGLYRELAATQ
jgi:alpha-L-fucosidase